MKVECRFETVDINYWRKPKQGTYGIYTCIVDRALIRKPGTIISEFKGKHEDGKQKSSVAGFATLNCTIKYFPIGVSSFPNLKYLSVDTCGLVSLTRNDLKGLEGLEQIGFPENQLTSLPSDLFVGFRKLKSICFAFNKLKLLSSKLLEPVLQNGLEHVNFLFNTKIDACYDKKDENEMTLKQLMHMIDEKCDGFKLENFDSNNDLWASKAFSDFTVVTKDSQEIPVHKCVLGVKSSVFAAAFNNDMEEKRTNRMVIDTFSPEAVEQFLKSFYTGRIQDDVNALDLFDLAAQFDVSILKLKCEEIILQNLDESNAFEIFQLAHLHSLKQMKEKAFKKIKDSMPDKTLKESWKDDPEKLKIIVEASRELTKKMQAVDDNFDKLKKTMEEKDV